MISSDEIKSCIVMWCEIVCCRDFFKVLDGPANKKAFKKWMTSPHHGGTIIEAWSDKVQINRGFQ
jgi:hypothetical protein